MQVKILLAFSTLHHQKLVVIHRKHKRTDKKMHKLQTFNYLNFTSEIVNKYYNHGEVIIEKIGMGGGQYIKMKRIREIERVYGAKTLLFCDLIYLRLRLRRLPFKYMNCCSPYPIILNIVAPLSPVLTP